VLTPLGNRLIEQYRAIEAKAHAAVNPELRELDADVSRGVEPGVIRQDKTPNTGISRRNGRIAGLLLRI
jgi:hypothetical protein